MRANGNDQKRLTTSPGTDSFPSWSPDGSRIVFESTRAGNTDIYVMNADGSDQRPLVADPAVDFAPHWSPDGQQIAFTSNREGDPEIYLVRADGSSLIQLTNNSPQEDSGSAA